MPEIQQAKGVELGGRCLPSPAGERLHTEMLSACKVLALLCFAARQPHQHFPAGLMGLPSLIPAEFQAANFGDSHVVRQQPATHARRGSPGLAAAAPPALGRCPVLFLADPKCRWLSAGPRPESSPAAAA